MGLHHVAFLPPQVSFSTSLKKCGSSEGLWIITYDKNVVRGMLPVKYVRSNKASSLSVECYGDHKTVTKLRLIWSPSMLGILPDFKQWCLSVCLFPTIVDGHILINLVAICLMPTINFHHQSTSFPPQFNLPESASFMFFLSSISSSDLQPQTMLPSRHEHPISSTLDYANAHRLLFPIDLLLRCYIWFNESCVAMHCIMNAM